MKVRLPSEHLTCGIGLLLLAVSLLTFVASIDRKLAALELSLRQMPLAEMGEVWDDESEPEPTPGPDGWRTYKSGTRCRDLAGGQYECSKPIGTLFRDDDCGIEVHGEALTWKGCCNNWTPDFCAEMEAQYGLRWGDKQ